MQGGLYRGLGPAFALGLLYKFSYGDFTGGTFPALSLVVGTGMCNPILNLQTWKQVVRGPEVEPQSYATIWRQNPLRTVTLGYTAHLARNFALAAAFIPALAGSDMESLHVVFGMGALLLSHPFEVARVLIVDREKSHATGRALATIRSLYINEGIAGLYKGFIPRTIQMLPVIATAGFVLNTTDLSRGGTSIGYADKQAEAD